MDGQAGILCTNEKVETVIENLNKFVRPVFARNGSIVNQTVVIPRGVIKYGGDIKEHTKSNIKNDEEENDDEIDIDIDEKEDGMEVTHVLNPLLNSLGLPSKVNLNQKLVIQDDFVVCQNGDKLNESKAHLLVNIIFCPFNYS